MMARAFVSQLVHLHAWGLQVTSVLLLVPLLVDIWGLCVAQERFCRVKCCWNCSVTVQPGCWQCSVLRHCADGSVARHLSLKLVPSSALNILHYATCGMHSRPSLSVGDLVQSYEVQLVSKAKSGDQQLIGSYGCSC
jgi:hypothetical protein